MPRSVRVCGSWWGTDYIVAGADVHRELEQLVMAGLTSAQAMHAATAGPAEYFGVLADYGVVNAGKVADLLLSAPTRWPISVTHSVSNTSSSTAVFMIARRSTGSPACAAPCRGRSWSVACKILWRFIRNPAAY